MMKSRLFIPAARPLTKGRAEVRMDGDFLLGLLLRLQQQPAIARVTGLPPDAKPVGILPLKAMDGSIGMALVIESVHLSLTPPGQPLPVIEVRVNLLDVDFTGPATHREIPIDDVIGQGKQEEATHELG